MRNSSSLRSLLHVRLDRRHGLRGECLLLQSRDGVGQHGKQCSRLGEREDVVVNAPIWRQLYREALLARLDSRMGDDALSGTTAGIDCRRPGLGTHQHVAVQCAVRVGEPLACSTARALVRVDHLEWVA